MASIRHRAGRARTGLAALAVLALLLALAPSASAAPLTSRASTSSWTFSGSGFGHGVGMSQYGALAQAKAGRSAQQILAFYYRGTTYDAVPDTQTIRVNVLRAVSTSTIRGSAIGAGGGRLSVTAGGRTLDASAGQVVNLRRWGDKVVAGCSTCTTTVVSGASAQVVWDESRTQLSVGGRQYRHAPFVVTPTPAAPTLEGVLHLRLADEYLNQIREVPWSWPQAALQAQAAAARAYALRKVAVGPRADCACHVQDGQSDQVYGPVPTGADAVGWSQWRAAVAVGGGPSTGFVPRYGGQVIEAFYSSSSSGRTAANEEVWPGDPLPYLRSVYDPWSTTADNPRRAWTLRVTAAQLAAAFDLPDVTSLDLSARSPSGRVALASARSTSGTRRTITGIELRSSLGLSSLAVQRAADRVGGTSPADLAAASARTAPISASTVVIASADEADRAHLVMARPLAGSLRAPLLLSGRTSLMSATVRELDRRGSRITRAYVVAGSPMVSTSVIAQLQSRGIAVTRVGLSDKDTTAAAIVDLMAADGRLTRAGVSSQATVPEAGAFSAVAGSRREPIVWAGATKVGYRARAALQRAGVGTVRVLGPTTRIPADVSADLARHGFTVTRFSGSSPSLVSAQIAEYFHAGYVGERVVLAAASTSRSIDPVLAAGYGAPVLVVTTSAPGSVTSLVQRSPQWPRVRAFGSSGRVPSAALTKVRAA